MAVRTAHLNSAGLFSEIGLTSPETNRRYIEMPVDRHVMFKWPVSKCDEMKVAMTLTDTC
jgi:hypothetical protein